MTSTGPMKDEAWSVFWGRGAPHCPAPSTAVRTPTAKGGERGREGEREGGREGERAESFLVLKTSFCCDNMLS